MSAALRTRRYGAAVDLWAVGCVIAQMLRLDPILPGESDIDQIFVVATLLGTPTEVRWPGVSAMPDYGKIEIPELEPELEPIPVPLTVVQPVPFLVLEPELQSELEPELEMARVGLEQTKTPRNPLPLQ